jgi:hypothetical protein
MKCHVLKITVINIIHVVNKNPQNNVISIIIIHPILPYIAITDSTEEFIIVSLNKIIKIPK